MNKKAVTILGAIFLLIVGTVGFLLYQKSKNSTPKPQASNTQDTNTNNSDNNDNQNTDDQGNTDQTGNSDTDNTDSGNTDQDQASGSGAVKIVDEEVVSPILFYQGNGITYFNNKGQLFQMDLSFENGKAIASNKRELTVPLKSDIKKIIWPLTGNNYAAQMDGSGGRHLWSIYNSTSGTYVDLPEEVTSFNWIPSGDKILYIWLDKNGQSTLNVANPDNSNYQTITDIWENDDDIAISPDGRNILFYRTGSTDSINKINLVSPDGKIFKSIVKEGYNKGVLWSPDSKKFLFARRDPSTQKFQLWMGNLFSGEIKNLNVYATVDKATWSSDSKMVYAAAPKDLASSGTELTQDTLFGINIDTGEQNTYNPGTSVDAQDLFLSLPGDKLFFKNLQDGGLYYLPVGASVAASQPATSDN